MSNLKLDVREEAGYDLALEGLSYNRNAPYKNMPALSCNLAGKGFGHDKFMRMIHVWLEITAPRYWWLEMDTYKVGTVCQSQSTMNTIMKRDLQLNDFVEGTTFESVLHVNDYIRAKDFTTVKKILPEGFLQKRMWCGNYAVLYNIYVQRYNHRLIEWREFCDQLADQIEHPELLARKHD